MVDINLLLNCNFAKEVGKKEKLKQLRIANNMTQEELAEKLGTARTGL